MLRMYNIEEKRKTWKEIPSSCMNINRWYTLYNNALKQ